MEGDVMALTIQMLCACYLASRPHGGTTGEHCLSRWWTHHWGSLAIANLTHTEILDLAQLLCRQGRKETTLAHYLRFLRQACAWGVASGQLSHDPCVAIELPKERPLPLRILTEEEEARLCLALGAPYAEWVRFAIVTGLRESEQFHLRWADVDAARGSVMLPHATSGTFLTFALPAEAIALLQQWRALTESPWVFPDPDNFRQPIDFHLFYVRHWGQAIAAAQLGRLCWRDLRHSCGGRLALQGLPISEIQHFMRLWNKKHAYRYRSALVAAGTPVKPMASYLSPFLAPKAGEILQVLERDRTRQPVTFGELARLYATQHLGQRPSRKNFDRFYRQYWQDWADRPASNIQRQVVVAWFMGLRETPAHANKALTFLRRIYNWGKQFDLVDCPNPTEHIPLYRQQSRERFLALEEARRFMLGLAFVSEKLRAFAMILLLTGCRSGEARTMRWTDLDWEARLWRKPRTKNGVGHVVPLPTQAMEHLRELPKVSEWVFPGLHGKPWSKASMGDQWVLFRRRLGLDGVRLHDLRRTCASYLAISGENLPTIQSVLNHRSLGPTSIYARLNVGAVDRALQRQADRLFDIQEPGPSIAVIGTDQQT
jgi:integrase